MGFDDTNLRNKQFFTLLGILISVPRQVSYTLSLPPKVALTSLFSSYSFNLEVRLKKKNSYMHSAHHNDTKTEENIMRRITQSADIDPR